MNIYFQIILVIILIFLIIEMIFMFKLAKLVANFLNRIMFLGDGKIKRNTLNSGDISPPINKRTINGKTVNIYDKNYQLLLFKDSNCGTCKEISNHLSEIIPNLRKNVELLIIQKDTIFTDAEKQLDIIIDENLFEKFLITSVPTLVIIGDEGKILKVSNAIGSYNSFLEEVSIFLKYVS